MKTSKDLSKSLQDIQDAYRELREKRNVVQQKLELVTTLFSLEAGYSFYFKCGEEEYDFHSGDFFDEAPREWVVAIASVMSEQDYPVAKYHGEEFCRFFELTKEETELILSQCATDKQYREFISYEQRNSGY
jgi:hypothetical protein